MWIDELEARELAREGHALRQIERAEAVVREGHSRRGQDGNDERDGSNNHGGIIPFPLDAVVGLAGHQVLEFLGPPIGPRDVLLGRRGRVYRRRR